MRPQTRWCLTLLLLLGTPPAYAEAPLDPSATEQILRWSFGQARRPVKGPDPSTRKLHLDGEGAEEKTGVTATSLLPEPTASGESDRLLLIREGRLQRLRFSERALTPLPLPSGAPALSRLVALSLDGRWLYALGQNQDGAERLYRLELAGDAVRSYAPATARAELTDAKRFLSEHHLARCQRGGSKCLVVNQSSGVSRVEVTPQPGERALQRSQRATIVDVAWASPKAQSVYVLARDP